MILQLYKLSWKESFRTRFRNKSIFVNIIIGFFALYMLASFAFLGFVAPEIIAEEMPDANILSVINKYILSYFAIDLFMRFMIQTLPVVSIKPLLILPIKRSTIVKYLLLKSKMSFFNFLPLVVFTPLAINLTRHDVNSSDILIWFLTVSVFVMVNNFLNLFLKRTFNDNIKLLLPALAAFVVIFILDFFHIFSVREQFGLFLDSIISTPALIVIPIAIVFALYFINYKSLLSKLTLDESVKNKEKISTSSMDWADNFGEIAPYVKLDLKMLWRNKRSKSIVYMSFAFLLYGLIFYPNDSYNNSPAMLIFIAIFITGIFAINFGQFIPAWDSAHYSMLMTQRTNLLTYVKSKFAIMAASIVLFFVLSTPYVYFGWNILLMHLAAALYNLGVNISILLFLSSYNNKPIDLTRTAMMNYQGVGAKQWLIVFPLMGFPALFFWLGQTYLGFYGGIAILAFLGIIGIIFHQKLIHLVAQQLADRKYEIIEAFKEK